MVEGCRCLLLLVCIPSETPTGLCIGPVYCLCAVSLCLRPKAPSSAQCHTSAQNPVLVLLTKAPVRIANCPIPNPSSQNQGPIITLNPKPLNPKPKTLNPKPQTLNLHTPSIWPVLNPQG